MCGRGNRYRSRQRPWMLSVDSLRRAVPSFWAPISRHAMNLRDFGDCRAPLQRVWAGERPVTKVGDNDRTLCDSRDPRGGDEAGTVDRCSSPDLARSLEPVRCEASGGFPWGPWMAGRRFSDPRRQSFLRTAAICESGSARPKPRDAGLLPPVSAEWSERPGRTKQGCDTGSRVTTIQTAAHRD